jgi:hypothetical protein
MLARSLLEDADLSNDELAPIVRLLHHFDRRLHLTRGSPESLMPLTKRLMVKIAGRRADYHLAVFNRVLELRQVVPFLSDLKIISTSSGDDLDIISTSCGDDLKMAWPKAAKFLRSGVPTETETKTETRPNRSQSQSVVEPRSPGVSPQGAPARAPAAAGAAGASDVDLEGEPSSTVGSPAVLDSLTGGLGQEGGKSGSPTHYLSATDADWVGNQIRERFPQVQRDESNRWVDAAEAALKADCHRHGAFRWIERQILGGSRLRAEERVH